MALFAAKEGREDLVELLLGFKAEVDARDANTDQTPLWVFAQEGHTDTVLALLQAGTTLDFGVYDCRRQSQEREHSSYGCRISSYHGHTDTVLSLLQAVVFVFDSRDCRRQRQRRPNPRRLRKE